MTGIFWLTLNCNSIFCYNRNFERKRKIRKMVDFKIQSLLQMGRNKGKGFVKRFAFAYSGRIFLSSERLSWFLQFFNL